MVREDCPSDAAKKQNESSDETKLAEQKRTRELQSFGIALLPRVISTLLPVCPSAHKPVRAGYGRLPRPHHLRTSPCQPTPEADNKDASIKKAPITAYRL